MLLAFQLHISDAEQREVQLYLDFFPSSNKYRDIALLLEVLC